MMCNKTEKGGCGKFERFQVQIKCSLCLTELFMVRDDTPQNMHWDLQQIIAHDVFLPKLVQNIKDINAIPQDAGTICQLITNY